MVEERELSSEEMAELELMLPQAYRLLGADLSQASPVVVVGAIDEAMGRLRRESVDPEQAEDIAFALGYLLGEQWRVELSWLWRYVTLDDGYEQYAVVAPYRRVAYFPMQDLYDFLMDENHEEVNILLTFNMAVGGTLGSASDNSFYLPFT